MENLNARICLPCMAVIYCLLCVLCCLYDTGAYAEECGTNPSPGYLGAFVMSEAAKSKSLIEFETLEKERKYQQ